MSRLALAGLAVALLVSSASSTAWAQRDAGAKSRGDYRPFWDYGHYANRNRVEYVPASRAPVVTYRDFSYQPAPEVAAATPKSEPAVPAEAKAPAQPQTTYRSFSYQPQAQASGVRVVSPRRVRHLDPWMYPKSDDHRYGPY
ncbi:MAG: hypothetical protein U0795_26305 [Pirellulales bacterium]